MADGTYIDIQKMSADSFDPDTQLYNFKLEGDNTYYANDMLVHNKSGDGGGGGGGGGGGNGGGNSCFIAGTTVLLEDGNTKAIEDVKVGEILLARKGSNKVIEFDHTTLRNRELYSFNGGEYFVTSEHPFLTESGYKSIDVEALARENPVFAKHVTKMAIGDRIQLADKDGGNTVGEYALIEKIDSKDFDPETPLYNFKLDGDNTYFANNMLVHNKGGNSCFVAGTQVVLEDGKSVAIEDVKVGDKVQGLDGAINTVEVFDHPRLGDRDLYSINGGEYFVTVEHPFYTAEGWKSISPEALASENSELEVGELVIGDKIERSDGSHEKIITIDFKPAPADTQLYNFKMSSSGNHTYYANGYLVHNK